ncbi:MAG: hypothetical protein AB8B57_13370 [Congregibacter sp.]
MLRSVLLILFLLAIHGCASGPARDSQIGTLGCESFFIYVLCIADHDKDGAVDYMYFNDTKEIFMYEQSMIVPLVGVLPFHVCAIPMSQDVRKYSSQLLYSEDLSISQVLGVKAKLLGSYRSAQPTVDACYAELKSRDRMNAPEEAPFLIEDDWEEGSD